MAELAVTDGRPPPAGLPDGEFWCTRLDGGTVRIDQADPRILVSAKLLDAIISNPVAEQRADLAGCMPGHGYVGAVLHIHGVNRHVVYRVTEYVPRINGYIAEWPD
jgi:hypothetical protein